MLVKKEVMLNKLILHIGPGKCGSTSIQNFFTKHQNSCNEKVNFTLLDPQELDKICYSETSEYSAEYFIKLIKTSVETNSIAILSHEFLFNRPKVIEKICGIAKNVVSIDKIVIIGYSRKQSEFMVSAYSQWLFRSPERILEIKNTMKNNDFDTTQFTGLEKQLIGSIINNFYSARQLSDDNILNWNQQYAEIESLTSHLGVHIKCGVLPHKQSEKNLIEDFCSKSGLTLKDDAKELTNIKANSKFDENIIEAVNIATDLGLDVPTPHIDNSFFTKNSLDHKKSNSTKDSFLLSLKQYIDFYFLESNIAFCKKYNLDRSYFDAAKQYTKEEILNAVKTEQFTRKQNDVMFTRNEYLIGILIESLYHIYKIKTTDQ